MSEQQAAVLPSAELRSSAHSPSTNVDLVHDNAQTRTPSSSTATRRKQRRSVRRFYAKQCELEDALAVAETIGRTGSVPEGAFAEPPSSRVAVNLSLAVNIALTVIKVVALTLSGSLSVLSSLVDSALDLVAGVVIYVTIRMMRRQEVHKFPLGKRRFESLSTLIIGAIMGTAALEVILRAIEKLVANKEEDRPEVNATVYALLGVTVASKFVLYIYCHNNSSTAAQTLATDHLNDTVSNSITLIFTSVGAKEWFPADPIGAILIGCFIIMNWIREGRHHFVTLAGRAPDAMLIQQLTCVATNHEPAVVDAVDTVVAYHFGTNLIVEVDIVLDPSMPLQTAHDVGESLQRKLELFPHVDRAFVHLDVEATHNPDDEHKVIYDIV